MPTRSEPDEFRVYSVEMLLRHPRPGRIIFALLAVYFAYALSVPTPPLQIGIVAIGFMAAAYRCFRCRSAHRLVRHTRVLAVAKSVEREFLASTSIVSASIGTLAALGMWAGQLTAIAMCFWVLLVGYSAGIVVYHAPRPLVARINLLLGGMPSFVATLAWGGVEASIIALTFAAFLMSGWFAIMDTYRAARAEFALRCLLEQRAQIDSLTRLPNRAGLEHLFDRLPETEPIAIHVIDLDRFKPVNDRYGHLVGDALLRMIAARLESTVGDAGQAARFGGDEFVIVQRNVATRGALLAFAERLREVLHLPYPLADASIRVGASIGSCYAPAARARNFAALFETADAALLEAKRLLEHRRSATG